MNLDVLKSKRNLLIIAGVLVLTLLAGGGYFAYQKFYSGKLDPEKMMTFVMKNPNLTSDQAADLEQRFNTLKQRIQQKPDSFADWLMLGVMKKAVADYEGARDIWLYCGQMRPNNSPSFANLADLYANFLNDPKKAEAAIKQAIANDPNDYVFYLTLADIYRYKFPDGDSRFEGTLLEAMEKFPSEPNIVASLSAFYRETNQVQKAVQSLEKLVQMSPENQAAKNDLAELKAQLK